MAPPAYPSRYGHAGGILILYGCPYAVALTAFLADKAGRRTGIRIGNRTEAGLYMNPH